MEGNTDISQRRDRNCEGKAVDQGTENIPEPWLSVSLLSTRWYSPASLAAWSITWCLSPSDHSALPYNAHHWCNFKQRCLKGQKYNSTVIDGLSCIMCIRESLLQSPLNIKIITSCRSTNDLFRNIKDAGL